MERPSSTSLTLVVWSNAKDLVPGARCWAIILAVKPHCTIASMACKIAILTCKQVFQMTHEFQTWPTYVFHHGCDASYNWTKERNLLEVFFLHSFGCIQVMCYAFRTTHNLWITRECEWLRPGTRAFRKIPVLFPNTSGSRWAIVTRTVQALFCTSWKWSKRVTAKTCIDHKRNQLTHRLCW